MINHATDDAAAVRQKRIDFHMNYCVHYKPRGGMAAFNATPCLLGLPVEFGAKPCIGGHTCDDPLAMCPKWERRSLESAIARHESIEEIFRRMEKVGPVVAEWRKKLPRGKQEVIECPACGGRLHLSQAASNGHVWGKCETADCVSWME